MLCSAWPPPLRCSLLCGALNLRGARILDVPDGTSGWSWTLFPAHGPIRARTSAMMETILIIVLILALIGALADLGL